MYESQTCGKEMQFKLHVGTGVVLAIARILFSCSFLISSLVLVGYAAGVTKLHTWTPSVSMAIPTAICLILNSVAGFTLTTLIRYAANKPEQLE